MEPGIINNISEDHLLLQKLKIDDTEAFDLIYERHWSFVYSAAMKRLNDADVAKDITQDIFLQLWSRRKDLVIGNLQAYLFTAVRNNVFKWMEKEKRYTPIPDLLLQLEKAGDQADAELQRKEFLKLYDALVATLTPSQQVIFRMRYNQDLSTDEIAQQLNVSRKTVQNQLGKSIAQLRGSFILISLLSLIRIFQ